VAVMMIIGRAPATVARHTVTDESTARSAGQSADHAAMRNHIADHATAPSAVPVAFARSQTAPAPTVPSARKPAAKAAVAILFIATSLAAPPKEMRETRGAFR
jgi:hypothetical protein